MKTRESGMPDEQMWEGVFSPLANIERLNLTSEVCDLVDFSCGYGTFTLAAARVISRDVYAIAIEPEMVATTLSKAEAEGLRNVKTVLRDFVGEGTGLSEQSVDYVMLFNILHAEKPDILLIEASRILRPGGLLPVLHWKFDPETPRGPVDGYPSQT